MTAATYGLFFTTENGQGEIPGRRDFAALADAEHEIPAFLQELLRIGTDDDADSILKGKFAIVKYEKGEFSDTEQIVLRKCASDFQTS